MTKSQEEIRKSRPTSPHLSIYRLQISSVLSIGHRLTGAGLFFSLSIMAWWFIFFVFSQFNPCYFRLVDTVLAKIIILLTSYAFFYHLCTGIRHLFWDTGIGFSIKAINITGWIAVFSSFVLTLLFWMYLC